MIRIDLIKPKDLRKIDKMEDQAPRKKLSDLQRGDKGTVWSNRSCGEIRKRLLDMGLVKGTEFKVVRKAPLGDPIEIQINGFLLTLRLEEAENVMVEV